MRNLSRCSELQFYGDKYTWVGKTKLLNRTNWSQQYNWDKQGITISIFHGLGATDRPQVINFNQPDNFKGKKKYDNLFELVECILLSLQELLTDFHKIRVI